MRMWHDPEDIPASSLALWRSVIDEGFSLSITFDGDEQKYQFLIYNKTKWCKVLIMRDIMIDAPDAVKQLLESKFKHFKDFS